MRETECLGNVLRCLSAYVVYLARGGRVDLRFYPYDPSHKMESYNEDIMTLSL